MLKCSFTNQKKKNTHLAQTRNGGRQKVTVSWRWTLAYAVSPRNDVGIQNRRFSTMVAGIRLSEICSSSNTRCSFVRLAGRVLFNCSRFLKVAFRISHNSRYLLKLEYMRTPFTDERKTH